MLTFRPAQERGHVNHGWLDANYTFSFGGYYDPQWMGFHALRVLNEDVVAPGHGFGTHPHDNIEILTYMISGTLGHTDSTGANGDIVPGELQHISAGSGICHSEQNISPTEPSHSLQIWMLPNRRNVPPLCERRLFPIYDEPNCLHLLASVDGRDRSFRVCADAELLGAELEAAGYVQHRFRFGNGYLHVARGTVIVKGGELGAGDGLALSEEPGITIGSEQGAEVLLFDLA